MKASPPVRALPHFLLFFLIVATGSCSLLDPPLQFGNPRAGEELSGIPGQGSEPDGPDTLLVVSAVEFPVSYDWQRDSAFGNVSCTLRLFRGREVAVSIPAGRGTTVSAAPDGHHIIEGDLYTLYSDARGTFVGRNGGAVAQWEGREYIVGLIPRGKSVYTLGRVYGGGLSLRCDGRELFSDPEGTAFGGFGTDTYGPTGALYEYDGTVCFAYRSPDGVRFVQDGEITTSIAISGKKILDAKIVAGTPALLYNQSGSTWLRTVEDTRLLSPNARACWTSAGLVEYEGRICAAGSCGIWSEQSTGWGIGSTESFYRIAGHPDYLYFSGGACLPLDLTDAGFSDCRFFSRSCAGILDGEMALALTPKDPAHHPFVSFKGSRTEYPLYGFLSGVGFQIID